jgi:hypothetical protein
MLSACEVYVLGIGALVRLLRGAAGAVGEVNYLFGMFGPISGFQSHFGLNRQRVALLRDLI